MLRNELKLFEEQVQKIKRDADFVGYECISREAIKRMDGQLSSRDADALQEQARACKNAEQGIDRMIEKLPALTTSLKGVKYGAMRVASCRFFSDNYLERMNSEDRRLCDQAGAALQKAEEHAIKSFKAYEAAEANLLKKR